MKFKNGQYAIYMGKEYTSGSMGNGKLVLRSTDIEDVKYGFETCNPFKYRNEDREIVCLKYVDESEVESYYKLTMRAVYKGYDFEMVDESENEICIESPMGDYRVWEGLGMRMVDRDVYQKWIKKDEAEIRIVKRNYK